MSPFMTRRLFPTAGRPAESRRIIPRFSSILLLTGSFAASMAAGEAALRLCRPSARQPFLVSEYSESERGKFCMYDPNLGWAGRPNVAADFSFFDCRHGVRQNKYGFRGTEYGFARTAKKRIAVLGDSFVWGFGVEDTDIFTSVMERESNPPIEIINLGVSGYGTDQEYLLWRSLGVRFQPDEVLLAIVPENDLWNNVVNVAYGYPKPVFEFTKQGGYRILNQPVPPSGAGMWASDPSRSEPVVSEMRQRNLLVRVAGYSAYFVELNKALQDDIIGRTELSFD